MTKSLDSRQALEEILTAHGGPLHDGDIARRLRDAGVADPTRIIRRLHQKTTIPAGQLADGRWVWLPAVLAGRLFTHRISTDEADLDVLAVDPDLAPIAALCCSPTYQRLADGSPVRLVEPGDAVPEESDIPERLLNREAVLTLPVGTFGALGVNGGELVGLRLNTEGLVLERVESAGAGTASAHLVAAFDEQPHFIDTLVWTACQADPELFTEATVPLSELIVECGLAQRGPWVAPPDFDFAQWEFATEGQRLALRHHLSLDQTRALTTLLQLYRRMVLLKPRMSARIGDGTQTVGDVVDEAIDELVADIGPGLTDPTIMELLAFETGEHGRFGVSGLRMVADALEPKVAPAARAGCQWLRAVTLERVGDVVGFEQALLRIEAAGGEFPLALMGLARLAADRGDAEAGLALLQRADAPADHPLRYLLHRYRAGTELPLPERAGWLYQKAVQHMLFGDWADLYNDAAYARCRSAVTDDEDVLDAALLDPVVLDAVLFEGGALGEFVDARRSLLPDDELTLAKQWLKAPRSVFTIEHVHRGGTVIVCDVRNGERHRVDQRTAEQRLRSGQLVCARVAPDGGKGLRFFGLELVSVRHRDQLMKLLDTGPDPVELVARLSGVKAREARGFEAEAS